MGLRASRPRRWLAWVAACALLLLLVQTLGALHGVVHADATAIATGESQVAGDHPEPTSKAPYRSAKSETGRSFLLLLFAGHESDSDCRAYDQLCHFDAIADFASPALVLVLQTFVLVLLAGLAKARWHALHQARGPPLLR